MLMKDVCEVDFEDVVVSTGGSIGPRSQSTSESVGDEGAGTVLCNE